MNQFFNELIGVVCTTVILFGGISLIVTFMESIVQHDSDQQNKEADK